MARLPASVGASRMLPLNGVQYLAYVSPMLMLAFLWAPMGIVQGIYAKYFGVTLTAIASVFFIASLFDAVTDPLVGYFSDRYQIVLGSRKPFVLVGGLLFLLSSYFLYVPLDPSSVDDSTVVSVAYLLFWFLLFYFSYTLMEIPHMAWASELASTSREKNKIYSLRSLSSSAGILCFYLVPFLPFFKTQEFTPETLQWAVLVAVLFTLPVLWFCLLVTPNGPQLHHQVSNKNTLIVWRREVFANKPFLLFVGAFFIYSTGSGTWFSLQFILIDSYLNLGHYFAKVTLLALVCSMFSLRAWYYMANRFGKKCVLGLAAFLYAMGAIVAGFLEPGQQSLAGLYLSMFLSYIASSALMAVAPSLLADIIDYSAWKFNSVHTAAYFSLYTFTTKSSMAIGGALGLGLAGWYGFNPAITLQAEGSVVGLRLAACWLPALFMVLSIGVISLIPINSHRHQIIRRRLDLKITRDSNHQKHYSKNPELHQTFKPIKG